MAGARAAGGDRRAPSNGELPGAAAAQITRYTAAYAGGAALQSWRRAPGGLGRGTTSRCLAAGLPGLGDVAKTINQPLVTSTRTSNAAAAAASQPRRASRPGGSRLAAMS